MLSVEEARARILEHVAPLGTERVALANAAGRVLAVDAASREPIPPFDNSAMDGYALRAEDTSTASADAPVSLRLVGEVAAGAEYLPTLSAGEAVRIFTGAPVPTSANAVIEQEAVSAGDGQVTLVAPAHPGNHIRPKGEDIALGSIVLKRGSELGPAEIGVLATLGYASVEVSRQPRVAILGTGDELVPPGEPLRPAQIRDSNAYYLAEAVRRAGGIPLALGIVGDDEPALRERLSQAADADLLLTSGGVSVGEHDLVKRVLSDLGSIDFWRVRVRPGRPLAFGLLGATPVLGLPGNPVSAAVTFELFGRPAMRRMLGATSVERPLVSARLAGATLHRTDRRQYLRCRLATAEGVLMAHPASNQGSHITTSLVGASGLLIVYEGEGALHDGDTVPVLLLNDGMPWGV